MLSYFCYILLFISRLTSLSLALQTTYLIKHGTNSYTTNSGTTHRMAGCGTLVAMFTVVCCHCTDPFNFYPGTSPDIVDIKFWGAVYGAALRPCVPLFVMITGALLLPVRGDASAFYKKRIPRVFFPFLIWSVIYNLFPWITGLLGVEPKVILDFFPYSGEEVMRQSLAVSLGYIAEMPFNFSLLDVHMWYIYLLIGLYLYLRYSRHGWRRPRNVPNYGFLQHGE